MALSSALAHPARPVPTSIWSRLADGARRVLPEGRELPEDEWEARHRAILWIIMGHAIGVGIFGLVMGADWRMVVGQAVLIALVGGLAAWRGSKRRFRASVAALSLVLSSAAIVQFSGGYIEAHFHFFVMLAVIALYQDWAPFLLAILYVALDHGVIGTLFPTLVYNHADAFANPWKWALIHAALVLGESAALLMGWKIAETARRRTALVLDSAGEGIFGLDLDGKITFANPAASLMTQRPVTALNGQPIETFLQRQDGRTTIEAGWLPHGALAADASPMSVVRPDGSLVAVEWEQAPILNNNVVIGTVLTLKDMTERRRAEESLRRAVSTLTATLESTTDGILVIDQAGRIAGFNKKFVEMWGIPNSILATGVDQDALEHVKSQLMDPAGFLAKVRELYAQRDATSFDVLDFRDGRVFERYSQPQRIGDAVIGRVWSFRDITERRQAEKALREQEHLQETNTRLRELDRMKTQFINSAAHELGTPLTPIKLQTHMLRSGTLGPLTVQQSASVNMLHRNVDQLQLLLRDVIDSARVQAGKLDVRLQPTPLRRVLDEAVESFAAPAHQQGVAIALHATEDVVATADGSRLTQVLFNLIRNALKYTHEGGRIDVTLVARGKEAVIEVRDTGQGIAAADMVRLFKPFSQLNDHMEHTRSGAGLGLYISHGIIESHSGTLSCESEGAGKGSTFRVTLPLA